MTAKLGRKIKEGEEKKHFLSSVALQQVTLM